MFNSYSYSTVKHTITILNCLFFQLLTPTSLKQPLEQVCVCVPVCMCMSVCACVYVYV